MTVNEIKQAVLGMMASKYGSGTAANTATDGDIAGAFFMRQNDATAIRDCCTKNSYKVAFRTAGANTLTRINAGNPCKGHIILDKSIKQKGSGWTYNNPSNLDFSAYAGLVGHSNDANNNLDGVWSYDKDKEAIITPIANVTSDKSLYYTGDYDMHDLIKNDARILAATVDESSAIDALNNALLRNDATRKAKIDASQRTYKSPYALIRHGAQTSFLSYLLSNDGASELEIPDTARMPKEDQILNIDPNIVMFDEAGKAYILDSISKIYWFYKTNDLLNQIPFYYFFKDLRTVAANQTNLDKYTTYLNSILSKYKISA